MRTPPVKATSPASPEDPCGLKGTPQLRCNAGAQTMLNVCNVLIGFGAGLGLRVFDVNRV